MKQTKGHSFIDTWEKQQLLNTSFVPDICCLKVKSLNHAIRKDWQSKPLCQNQGVAWFFCFVLFVDLSSYEDFNFLFKWHWGLNSGLHSC
jgi:hypothetical protein